MSKFVDGSKEIVEYREFPSLLVYDNTETEGYPNHWHPSMEILMPTEKTYDAKIGDTTFHLEVGDILFIAPGVLHELSGTEGRRTVVLTDFSMFNSLTHAINPIHSFIHPALAVNKDTSPELYRKCHDLIVRIYDEYFGSRPFRELDMYSSLLQMMTLIGRSYATNGPSVDEAYSNKQQAYIDRFVKICEYIDTHYNEDLTLEKVAELAGFSKFHFERLFKNFTGTTFYKYLNQIRIAQSRSLITNPNLTLTEVALQSGFNSSSTFIRMFKQLNGCTPTEFKNNYRPNEIDEPKKIM